MIKVLVDAGMLMYMLTYRLKNACPVWDGCLPYMHLMTYMQWVAAGKLVAADTIYRSLSVLELPTSISAIEVINQSTCHAALVSAELRFGHLHGVMLQAIAECVRMVWLFSLPRSLPCRRSTTVASRIEAGTS